MKLLSLLLACIAADNPNPWQQVSQNQDVTVWARDVPDSGIREIKAESVVPLPAERVWSVVLDTEHYADFMPYVDTAQQVATADPSARYEYQRLAPPLVKKRDYVLRTQSQADPQAGAWVHSWAAVADVGPPPRSDAVRVTVVDGSWTLKRLDAEHTHITYRLFTDPGGSVPRWIANRANSQSIPALMDALKRRAQDPSYHR